MMHQMPLLKESPGLPRNGSISRSGLQDTGVIGCRLASSLGSTTPLILNGLYMDSNIVCLWAIFTCTLHVAAPNEGVNK